MASRDQFALLFGARAEREQIPNAAAVIRAAEQRVKNQRDNHHSGDNRFKRHAESPAASAYRVLRAGRDLPQQQPSGNKRREKYKES